VAVNFEIRPAVAADARALSELAVRAKSHWGYPADWIREWRDDLTLTAEYLSVHQGFVAVDSECPVGVCVLEIRDDAASLEHVWIAPEYHRRGIGRALVATALETAARAGVRRVEVLSDPFAEPFYTSLGARRVSEVAAAMPGAPDRTLPRLEFVIARQP
jgi:predicted N-acetyltransferase YhbS